MRQYGEVSGVLKGTQYLSISIRESVTNEQYALNETIWADFRRI